MKVRTYLDALYDLPITTPAALTDRRPFVVVSPHPDDESLGCGGLIAAACAVGQPVEVVILTDGAGSHRQSRAYPAHRLVALRKAEAAKAARHLGLDRSHLRHLGLPDAHMPASGSTFETTVETLRECVERLRAVSVFVTWGLDPHCDHEAADGMARALRRKLPALKLWSYPIWGWHLPVEAEIEVPWPSGFRIDIAPWRAAKMAAIAAHASQMTNLIADDPAGFRFDDGTIAPFVGGFEYFIEVPQ